MTTPATPYTLHVRIGRLVVDRDALGDVHPGALGAAVEAALAARLTHVPTGVPEGLAGIIADAVAPTVEVHSARVSNPPGGRRGTV